MADDDEAGCDEDAIVPGRVYVNVPVLTIAHTGISGELEGESQSARRLFPDPRDGRFGHEIKSTSFQRTGGSPSARGYAAL